VYNITNGIFGKFGFPLLKNDAPNLNGVLLHGVVLAIGVLILNGLLLPCNEKFELPEDEKNKKN
jgi:1,4-dihydroxy-2-naphthoate octaprenyltransferase